MKRLLLVAIATLLLGSASYAYVYNGPWTQTWDFNDGLQGWTLAQGTGYWVDPAVMPNGPTLPDGGASNAGAGNVYAPDGTRFEIAVNPTNSFVVQVDAWLPNLMPLNINTYLPGNGVQDAGVGAVTQAEGKAVYVAGRNPDGVKIRDHSWDNTDRSRTWLLEEAGVAKADMWDKWITMQFAYNIGGSGKFTGAVYTPWDSGVHDGPGWYEFAAYDIHPEVAKQFVNKLTVGAVKLGTNSWTQAQFDNVKFYDAVPEPGSMLALGTGLIGLLGLIRRRK